LAARQDPFVQLDGEIFRLELQVGEEIADRLIRVNPPRCPFRTISPPVDFGNGGPANRSPGMVMVPQSAALRQPQGGMTARAAGSTILSGFRAVDPTRSRSGCFPIRWRRHGLKHVDVLVLKQALQFPSAKAKF
jgi:hypothetical protein